MAHIGIVGDGPAALQAALLLAKNGHDTTVWGQGKSLVAWALLRNYLGAPDTEGPAFMEVARGQVVDAGADLQEAEVTAVAVDADGATVTLAGGDEIALDYVLVANGKAGQSMVQEAGGDVSDGAVVVDGNAMTTVDRLYAAGHLVRPERSQAIISAGMGAMAASDILSREAGEPVHDWDSLD